MNIDNTAYSMYAKCPKMFFERYEAMDYVVQQQRPVSQQEGSTEPLEEAATALDSRGLAGSNRGGTGRVQEAALGQRNADVLPIIQPGIELDAPSESRDFGTRMHQLLHERRCKQFGLRDCCSSKEGLELQIQPEWPDEDIEAEAQATLAAYEAHYIKDFEYLESERTSTVELPFRCPVCWNWGVEDPNLPAEQKWCNTCNRPFEHHGLIVKLDAVVRYGDGTIGPFDTKTEAKPGYNTWEDWIAKTQGKAYLYALGLLYPNERVSRLTVDIIQRGSPKAHRGPVFTRLDDIASAPEAIDEYLRNVVWVCDDIEKSRKLGFWRSNTNLCKRGWDRCDYFWIHVNGRTEANLRKYRPAEQYLDT